MMPSTDWLAILSLVFLAYLNGSIPFSVLVSRAKGVDLKQVGSGNLGATNVYRALGIKFAALVFFLDALKAYLPTTLAVTLFQDPVMHLLIGGAAIVGHTLSVFVKFKGGKGVAPSLGVLFALAPEITGVVFVIGFTLISLFRYVAPVSIVGSLSFPVLLYLFHYPIEYVVTVGLLALYIVWKHKSNIIRMLKGKENRV